MKSRNFFKALRWLFFALVCVATVAALFVGEENLRGKWAWERCKRELEAQGEHMNRDYFVPPKIPNDQNFAMAPFIQELYAYEAQFDHPDDHKDARTLGESRQEPIQPPIVKLPRLYAGDDQDTPRPVGKGGGWQRGNPRDLQAWQAYYRIVLPHMEHPQSPEEDVMASLAGMDGLLAELREADKTRPLSRFPVKYELGIATGLPHLQVLRELSVILSLRATAELRLNRTDDAFADMQLTYRVMNLSKDEPIFFSQMVCATLGAVWIGPLWEGIQMHRWSDSQLATMQAELERFDFLSGYLLGIRADRTEAEQTMILITTGSMDASIFMDPLSPSDRRYLRVAKYLKGWVYQNVTTRSLWMQQNLSCVDVKMHKVDLQEVREFTKKIQDSKSTPYVFLAKFGAKDLMYALRTFSVMQTYVDEARVACAIERYRIAHRSLPATLDDLHMENLPHDVIDGGPLHYRVTGDAYVLYSVGWNGTDDGGEIAQKEYGAVDFDAGDWVWSMPAAK